ncbi:hypothetical protein BH10ACI4_BH10ACI4_23250 [soil metagenome]
MSLAIHHNPNQYRVVLVHPDSRQLYVLERESNVHLVRMPVEEGTRPARQLQEALREWGLAVVILDVLMTKDSASPCAIAELLRSRVAEPFKSVSLEQIPEGELSAQERIALQEILDGDATNPFSRVGWIHQAIQYLEASTGGKVCAKADVEQYNASGTFSLVRFRMVDGCEFWLKATGVPNTHERRMMLLLSDLCRGFVPEVVAEIPAWNAWLMRGEGQGLAALPNDASEVLRLLGSAVDSLAALQRSTVDSEAALFLAGAVDHKMHVLRSEAEALFFYVQEAMGRQISTRVPRIETKRLLELQVLFEDVCSAMEDLEIPDMVLHGDMNLANLLFAHERCIFIDWCEAYVGNPLVTLEHLLLFNPIEDEVLKLSCDKHLKERYRRAMSGTCDPRFLEEGFALAPVVAAGSAIFARGDWFRTPLRDDPRRQAYVRSVARSMDRAARQPALRRALSV